MTGRRIFKLMAKYFPGCRVRKYFLRLCGFTIGSAVYIGEDLLVIDDPSDRRYTLTIGDRASVSPRVTFVLHSQPNDSRIVPYVNSIRGSITVGPDAWVGTGAVVLPGISIGEGAVVGANAVVTRDVPAYTVVAGVPAHRLRTVKVPWNIPQEINND